MSARRRKTVVAAAPVPYRPIELSDTQPHGWRAGDLPEADRLLSGTLFAAERAGATYKQEYDGISSDIKERSLCAMGVGDMAFADIWQYTPLSHDHAGVYTMTDVSAVYGQGEGRPVAVLSVGEPGVEGFKYGSYRTVTIYCPSLKPAMPAEPAYGTLRFMYAASADVDDAYISSDEFDGWIYPDGGTYNVNPDQFDPGKNPFITNKGPNPYINGNQLTAPKFDRFLKANPFTDALGDGPVLTCQYKNVPHHTAMAPHSHLITGLSAGLSLGIDVENSNIRIGTGYGEYKKTSAHWGGAKNAKPVYKKITAAVQLSSMNIQTAEVGDENDEVKPSRNLIAVMVYVGGRKKEYERIYA